MATHCSIVSNSQNYKPGFLHVKNQNEQLPLDFTPASNESYNDPISIVDIIPALTSCKTTAAGPDKIQYVMIKHMSDTAYALLVRIYNQIWDETSFSSSLERSYYHGF